MEEATRAAAGGTPPIPAARLRGRSSATPYHRWVTATRYRVLFTLLGLGLALVVVAAVLFAPSGRDARLPSAVERYAPADGSMVPRQARVQLDLRPGYAIDLIVDGVAIPASEIDVVEANGLFTWEPGAGKTFPEWTPGFHTVEASWDRVSGLPDPGSLRWTFRVQ